MWTKERVVGLKFGMVTIVKDLPSRAHHKRIVLGVCDCGNETEVMLTNLKTGHTTSCGCYGDKMRAEGQKTHGLSKTGTYKSYCKMLERCYNQKDINYHNYGGRGISVCDRWRESFENFFSDMGHRPSTRHSIERIKVNLNYTPENCTWATKKEQCNNKTTNKFLEYEGEVLTQQQWADKLGIHYNRIADKLRDGFSFNEIVDYIKANGAVKRLQMKPVSRKWWPRKSKQ